MKSSLKFDIGPDNEPVIAFSVDKTSTDLRDKVARRFFEELGHSSNTLVIVFDKLDKDSNTKSGTIFPVPVLDTWVEGSVDKTATGEQVDVGENWDKLARHKGDWTGLHTN